LYHGLPRVRIPSHENHHSELKKIIVFRGLSSSELDAAEE
jgi:hypothetical protein